jgi:S1-C subfamily serine protease
MVEVPRGSSSGFVWDKLGHVVTNFHVIQHAEFARVSFKVSL